MIATRINERRLGGAVRARGSLAALWGEDHLKEWQRVVWKKDRHPFVPRIFLPEDRSSCVSQHSATVVQMIFSWCDYCWSLTSWNNRSPLNLWFVRPFHYISKKRQGDCLQRADPSAYFLTNIPKLFPTIVLESASYRSPCHSNPSKTWEAISKLVL